MTWNPMRSVTTWLVVTSLVAVALFRAPADIRAAQPPIPRWSGPIDTVRVAHETLQAFFPELRTHAYPTVIIHNGIFNRLTSSEATLRDFGIAVAESHEELSPSTSDPNNRYLIAGMWMFTPDGDIDHMFLKGRANHFTEYQALLDDMIAHPTRTPAQTRAAFADRHVRYWPENEKEFLASVQAPIEKLSALLGGVPQNVHSTFKFGAYESGSWWADFELEVEVDIAPFFPGRPVKNYQFAFEPIGGKLLRIIGD
jgi:hypothetical protein